MITINYGLSLRLKGTRKKRQHKNCQGLQLDLRETQHKKIRAAIRAKHPGWMLEGFVIVDPKSEKRLKDLAKQINNLHHKIEIIEGE